MADITRLRAAWLKRVLRTGTVASTDNRNWSCCPRAAPPPRPSCASRKAAPSRARRKTPPSPPTASASASHGTLLCVSDKPLHGEIKLPGMANKFYRERVNQTPADRSAPSELMREAGRIITILPNCGVLLSGVSVGAAAPESPFVVRLSNYERVGNRGAGTARRRLMSPLFANVVDWPPLRSVAALSPFALGLSKA